MYWPHTCNAMPHCALNLFLPHQCSGLWLCVLKHMQCCMHAFSYEALRKAISWVSKVNAFSDFKTRSVSELSSLRQGGVNIQLNLRHCGVPVGVPLLVLPPADSSLPPLNGCLYPGLLVILLVHQFISTSSYILNMKVGLYDIPCYMWYFIGDSYQYEMYYKASSVLLNFVSNSLIK